MAEIKWIKIYTDIFDNKKIKQIEILPQGDTIIVIWYKLLCLAGDTNDNGSIYFTKEIPYTDEMLATAFNRPLQIIKMALSVFVRFGMIEIIESVIYISNWEKYQNVDGMEKIREQTRKRVEKFRDNRKQELTNNQQKNNDVTLRNVTERYNVTLRNAIDIDKDIDKDMIHDKTHTHAYAREITNLYQILVDKNYVGINDSQYNEYCMYLKNKAQRYGLLKVRNAINYFIKKTDINTITNNFSYFTSSLDNNLEKISNDEEVNAVDEILNKLKEE